MADDDLPQALVQRGLRKELMPRHVAFVMDGNRRWVEARGLTTAEGHGAGGRALEKILELSAAWGIRTITAEVGCCMELMERGIRDKMEEFTREGVRLHVIGDPSIRPASLQEAVREAEEMTRNSSRLNMILATGYSGRWDIVQACQELAAKVQDKLLRPEDIDEAILAGHLSTSVLTSGELRLSNFLLWQSAYTELYFTNKMWPDFGEDEYIQALKDFQSRERRFGQRKSSQA
ncbi:dehydrodolichyl diphosphate synthase 2-like [Panicum miliaceum]|uniref:Alkyl transferase n=1 Tax=Panicum miliaceum TaxID=4540 RepID=A0A3L6R9Q3_PANMI|nr:dehydrodolichyl diphosphate synthase 2-like [Panicum miliaceum]